MRDMGKMNTVLFVAFQTENRANGGIQSLEHIVHALKGEVSRVVLTNRESSFCERLRASGVNVIVRSLACKGTVAWPGNLAGVLRRALAVARSNVWIAWHLATHRVDAIHCNDPAPFWYVVPAAKCHGVKVVYNLRDTKGSGEPIRVLRYWIEFLLSDCVLVLSREMAVFYARTVRGSSSLPVTITHLYSVVDFSRYTPPAAQMAERRRRLSLPEDARVILFVAVFSPKKNQLEFLRCAAPMLLASDPRTTICFVGDFEPQQNAYAAECAVSARQFGDRVRFAGYTATTEDWYGAADVVVVPTRKEGLARCMIEGLACGTPVVSFDVCSAREILEGYRCGIVVPQGDYHALAGAVETLLSSAEARAALGRRAAAVARQLFSASTAREGYNQLLHRIGLAEFVC